MVSVVVFLADLLVGVIDLITLAALAGALATLGVYVPGRKEI